MSIIDFVLNIFESLIYAFITADYIGVVSKKRILYIVVFTVIVALEISMLNLFMLYEGIYCFIYIVTYTLLMTLFRSKNDSGTLSHIIIYAINLDGLVSLGIEIVFLFAFLLFKIPPVQVGQKYLLSAFLASRTIVIIISFFIHRFIKNYKQLSYDYDFYFVIVFAFLHVVVLINEGQLFNDVDSYITPIISNMLIFATVYITYFIYCVSLYDHFKNRQLDHLSLQLSHIKENSERFTEKETEIRTMKHDLINQLTIMDGYLKKGDISECQNIIRKNIGELNQMPVWINSGYTAIDAIVSTKFSLAKANDIKTFSFIQISSLTKEQEYDIALILGNLIDNAIENISSENRSISLQITQKERLIIVMENSTDKTAADLKTNKNDPANHGLGLNSIRLLATKNNGYLTTDLSKGVFTAVVDLTL